jgi:hypothetical protein
MAALDPHCRPAAFSYSLKYSHCTRVVVVVTVVAVVVVVVVGVVVKGMHPFPSG